MNEIVRSVEALQTTQASRLYTPANWKSGDDLLVPILYYPYTEDDLKNKPELEKQYYKKGALIWFKKNLRL
jgi:peroxiredoxin (alkyl hydroperoxide reductase subunit C)